MDCEEPGVVSTDVKPSPGAAGIKGQRPAPVEGIRLVRAFPNLKFKNPVFLGFAPDQKDRIFVVEQRGKSCEQKQTGRPLQRCRTTHKSSENSLSPLA